MRVMVLVKATEASERGELPEPEMLAAMGRFNEELAAAGVLRQGDGLKPSSAGVRVAFDGAGRTERPGPFGPAGEQVAGFWLWEVADLDEAVPGFASRYGCVRLVWFEVAGSMEGASLREKQIKAGSRARKVALIEAGNPGWFDLYDGLAG